MTDMFRMLCVLSMRTRSCSIVNLTILAAADARKLKQRQRHDGQASASEGARVRCGDAHRCNDEGKDLCERRQQETGRVQASDAMYPASGLSNTQQSD